jgi:hypothetical protein
MSTAIAQQAFDSTWPPFANAVALNDLTGVSKYADKDVQHAVAGWFGCGCPPWPPAYQQLYLSAPPQTQYPVSFLAEIHETDYDGTPLVLEAVLSKENADAPWLVSYLVSFVGDADNPGYLTATTMDTQAPTTGTDVSGVGMQLAVFFQTVDDTGQPPPNEWPQTGSIAQETQDIINSRDILKENGLTETLTYSVGTHSLAFAIPGGDLMCGEILSYSLITSSGNGLVVQPADQSVFGSELAPGSYSSVTSQGIKDACWTVTTDGVETPVSFFGGVYSRVGTKA